MLRYEFKVVPAPRRGEKARGVKTTEDRFALSLMQVMNALGSDGWDYVRADALPCDERVGLTGSKTTFQNVLVFRRVLAEVAVDAPPPAQRLIAMTDPVVPPAPPAAPPVVWPPAPGGAPALGPANGAARPGVAAE